MKADDLYKPLIGPAKRAPTKRQYLWGGAFCAAMAIGSVAVDMGWASAAIFGVLAVGSFRLAARQGTRAALASDDRDA